MPRKIASLSLTVTIIATAYLAIVLAIFYVLYQRHAIETTDGLKISDFISAVIAVASAFAGIIALVLSVRSLQTAQQQQEYTRKVNEGQLYIDMMERYSSAEMRHALRLLGRFRDDGRRDPKAALAQWFRDKEAGQPQAMALEDARHTVKYFYRDLMQLYQADYFSKDLIKRLLNPGGRHIFNDVVMEMEEYANRKLQFEGEFDPFLNLHAEISAEQKAAFPPKPEPRVICLIPARYDAVRFPGKLMKMLGGKSVIRYTYENVAGMGLFDFVAVVTNSEIIKNEIEQHGGNAIYLPVEHTSGTDRIAEAMRQVEGDIIVNVQGDEPFVKPVPLQEMVQAVRDSGSDKMVVSLMRRLTDPKQIHSADFVKVVFDVSRYALYFSRSIVPHRKNSKVAPAYYEHIGVYAFTKKSLAGFASLPPSESETAESIECLRFLDAGIPIKMVETDEHILEIDTEEDLVTAERLIQEGYF